MFKRVMLAATLLTGLFPLQAQIDSRLITNTDLLDVYKSTPAKPELLSIFDFSTSMHAVYWHPNYFGAASGYNHLTSAPNGKGWDSSLPDGDNGQTGIVPLIDSSGKVYMTVGDGPYGTPTFTAISYMDNSGSGRLVRPDGTLVPISGTYSQAQLTTLVQQASHIRMTATAPFSSGSVTRTIDLPIPWAILDNTSTAVTNPLVPLAIPDTIGGGPAITPDEAYLGTSGGNNNIVNAVKTTSVSGVSIKFYKIGLLRYNDDYLWWIFFGKDSKDKDGNITTGASYVVPAVTTPTAASPWSNGLPGMTRFQALKYCVVKTWLLNQKKVWWGFRYLDGAEEKKTTVSPDNGSASSTDVSRDIRLFRPAANSSSADPKLKNFVQSLPSGSTPLTFAFANGYSQLSLNKDASSTFGMSSGGGQSGTEKPIPSCRTTFMVVFTDGIANDTKSGSNTLGSAIGTGTDVYAQGNAAVGNTALGTLTTALAPGSSTKQFNIWTLSSVAAHYPVPTSWASPTSTTVTPSVGAAAPFLISDRGASTSNMRRIRTMTVGMSLFGTFADANAGKAAMYRAALYGNPGISTWVNPTSANPTPAFDPADSSRNDRNVNPFFFDAQSIDQLSAAMDAVVAEAITASGSISAPSAPLVGLSLGREAFLGLFQPASSGPIWRGDLLAAGLKISSTGDTFLGNDGTAVTSVTSENAIWSAGDLLQSEGLMYNFQAYANLDPTTVAANAGTTGGPRSWKPGARKVITNLTGTTLIDLNETTIPAGSASIVGATTEANRVAYIRFLRGAHASAESSSLTVANAPSIPRINIMGDIISSSPAVLEYPLSLIASSPVLSGVTTTNWQEKHFRVIFVADNQGYIHAFGELAGVLYSGTAPNIVQTPIAAVDELWAFFPGELLAGMPKYLRTATNAHIYGVDGPPVVYFNDKPGSNQVVGDGIVNGEDVVRVIVGMGKGGRNYYAFDVKDPFNPALAWKLIPDSASDAVVKKMGLATSTPALARVDVGSSANSTTDVLFIGGGLSTKAVDTSMGSALGRNLVAVNVLTGGIEKTWDFSAITNMGSLSAPVVAAEFLANTGRAQRVYFADQPIETNSLGTGTRGSGIWALGRTSLASNGVTRLDSSDITTWTGGTFAAGGLRKIYQCAAGQIVSTTPALFRLNTPYPVARTLTPLIRPAVMGLLFSSGDRNDPLDHDLINPSGQNQMMMVFDRQDSASMAGLTPSPASGSTVDTNGFTDADLYDLTGVTDTADGRITPTNDSYYLKTKFGYKLLMGGTTSKTASDAGGANYYPKAPSAPIALAGVLFFGILSPGNVPVVTGEPVACTGTGQTVIYRMCDLMAPVFSNGGTAADLTKFNSTVSNCSGYTLTFANIPGPLTGLGSIGVLVSGQGKTTGNLAGDISTAGAQAQVIPGKTQNFGFRLKTWRIVR
jgi:hypothetical protein